MGREPQSPGDLVWLPAPLPEPGVMTPDTEIVVWISTVKGPIVKTMVPIGTGKTEWCDLFGHPASGHLDGAVRWWAWLRKP